MRFASVDGDITPSPRFGLGLFQPEAGAHVAQEGSDLLQMLPRCCAFAGSPLELAEAQVTASEEQTHAELLCASHRLPIAHFGALEVGRVLRGGDVPEQMQALRHRSALP